MVTNPIFQGQRRLTQDGIEKKVHTLALNYWCQTCLYIIATKVMTFTADNALNNNTLVDELSVLIPTFGGAEYRVCCFAHILNLVVKVCGPFNLQY